MKNDFRTKQKKSAVKLYLIAFLVPVFIVTALYICGSVWPFGEECFMKTDMYHQYVPFFSEFRHKLVNGESLLYSRNVGMGVNFTAIYAYYLASPLNWLVVLVSESHVIEFMNVLTILKIGLCGVTFTRYLRGHSTDSTDFGPALFGIAYALSGYMCAYYWNTMWLDCIVLFPLIVGALEKLVREGKMFIYALLLGVCIFSNYYISIMICIFLILYFLALNILDTPDGFLDFCKRCAKFAASSLIAGALAAVLLLPAFYALQGSASASSTFPKTIKTYFSVVEMLARMQPCVETEQVLAHWPNIYSGTFVFLLFPLYLFARRISIREKVVYVCFALFLLASFSINALDYMWHGFHFPNSLPCRQSFCFVFLVLFMSYRAYQRKDHFRIREVTAALAAAVVFLLFVQKGADTKYYGFYVTWLALALTGLYAFVLCLYNSGKLKRGGAFLAALLILCAETTANSAVTSFTTCNRTYYTRDNYDVRALVSMTGSETDFFRYEKGARKTKNDGAWLNFPSVSLFSSTASANCSAVMTKLGCEASTNAYSITGSTPFVDMLLDVRYLLAGNELTDTEGRRLVSVSGDTWLYENEYTLPVGFVLPENLVDGWVFDFDNPALIQNSICDCLGVPHVLREEIAPGNSNGSSYSFNASEEGSYYAYITSHNVKNISVSISGETKTFNNVDRKYLVELGKLQENQSVTITSKTDGEGVTAEIYRFDTNALKEVYEKLAAQKVTVTDKDASAMRMTVTVDPAAMGYTAGKAQLFFSIPYDEGWTVYVNGEQVSTQKGFGDAFLCIELPKGTFDIRMEYSPKGLREGGLVSIAALFGLALLFFCDRISIKKRRKTRRHLPEVEKAIAEDRYIDEDDPQEE